MRIAILILFFIASLARAESDSDSKLLVRLSAGAGGASDMMAVDMRILAGTSRMPVLVGLQATGFTDIELFVTPSESNSSVHAIVAREVWRGGPASVLLYGGAGRAEIVERGELVREGFLDTEYESITTESPSALIGIDCGISFRRVVGVSLQAGALLNARPAGFMLVQADLGRW